MRNLSSGRFVLLNVDKEMAYGTANRAENRFTDREVLPIQPFLRQVKKLDPHNLSYTVRNNVENY